MCNLTFLMHFATFERAIGPISDSLRMGDDGESE